MKITKLILLLITISFFTSVPFDAKSKNDCSELKPGSHKWIMCNLGSKKYGDTASQSSETKREKKDKKKKKVKKESNAPKTLVDLFKKVKGE